MCSIPPKPTVPACAHWSCVPRHGAGVGDFGLNGANAPGSLAESLAKQNGGRWPANLILDPSAAASLNLQVGETKSGIAVTRNGGGGKIHEGLRGESVSGYEGRARPDGGYSDRGGPSRYFYCAKVSKAERDRGLDARPMVTAGERTGRVDGSAGITGRAGATASSRNVHPTLKSVALTRYLATLIMPPPRADGSPRKILVPYSGSGSEVIGALLAGWDDVTGIEREPQKPSDPDYVGIAEDRIRDAVAFPEEWCKPAAEDDEPLDGDGDGEEEAAE